MDWSADANEKIRGIQLKILKRKIMLNMLINRYSLKSKLFRWCQKIIASLAVFLGFLQYVFQQLEIGGTIAFGATIVYNILLHIRDYVTYDRTRDVAKEQNVKYQELYEEIDNECIKNPDQKQREHDFINWINRSYEAIYASDPDLTQTEQLMFEELCKKHNIVVDDDLNEYNKIKVIIEQRHSPRSLTNATVNTETVNNTTVNTTINKTQLKRKDAINSLNTSEDIKWIEERLNNF